MHKEERATQAGDNRPKNVWLQPHAAKRDPLTRARIVDAALGILDADGAAALTMRRLANDLRVGPATLYGHVRTKEDVLDLALDTVYAEVPLPDESDNWRTALSGLLSAWRSALLRHPWSSTVLGRPQLGPNMLAREEQLYALLAAGGLSAPELRCVAYALSNYVIGSVLMQIAWQQQDEPTRRASTDHVVSQKDLYPTLAVHRADQDTDWDHSFENGLGTLLDGIVSRH